MRIIDGDALAKSLSLEANAYRSSGYFAYAEGISNALWSIAHAPTVGGWISTKDGLPSRNRVYLITFKTPEGPPQVMEAYLGCDDTWWHGSVSLMDEYVTHWMPLPEPPKEMNGDENC